MVEVKEDLQKIHQVLESGKTIGDKIDMIDIEELRQILFILKYIKPKITKLVKENI